MKHRELMVCSFYFKRDCSQTLPCTCKCREGFKLKIFLSLTTKSYFSASSKFLILEGPKFYYYFPVELVSKTNAARSMQVSRVSVLTIKTHWSTNSRTHTHYACSSEAPASPMFSPAAGLRLHRYQWAGLVLRTLPSLRNYQPPIWNR